jgi:serine/threonine protein kinase
MNSKYEILEPIGCGSFGSVYKGKNKRTGEYVAIKMEPMSNKINLLKHESSVYTYLNNLQGVPQVRWFGNDGQNYYMVLNMLGDSLETVKQRYGRLSLVSTLQMGVQCLNLLMAIHDKYLLHRDIKPSNFVFGLGNYKLHLIDFGFCKSYIRDKQHIQLRKTSSLIGSLSFASMNSHNCIELTRRDDLESLGYVLLYLYLGRLDWQNDQYTSDTIRGMKCNIEQNKMIPQVFINYFKKIWCLGFEERPNYTSLIEDFSKRE